LAERLAAQERTLAYLEPLIRRKEGIMPYDVQVTEVTPQLVAATKVHTNPSRIGDDIGAGFGTLMMTLGREGFTPSGAPLIVYPDVIDGETDGDIEICVPVAAPSPAMVMSIAASWREGRWRRPSTMGPTTRSPRPTTR
jgi:hypothetical protein